MVFDHRLGAAGFPLCKGFSDTDDRPQTCLERCLDLLIDRLVCLVEIGALLAVADDDIGDPGALEHVARDLACKCTFLFPVNILSAQHDVRASDDLVDRGQADIGRANDHLGGCAFGGCHNLFCQGHGLRDVLVHLPVAGDNFSTHDDSCKMT